MSIENNVYDSSRYIVDAGISIRKMYRYCVFIFTELKNKQFIFCIIFSFHYLCPLNWFRTDFSAVRIKRESGVNPGQSRCCEALLKSWKEPLPLILCLYIGKASRSGVSQKTCHSLKSAFTRGIRKTVRKD